jgi:hypothetical protein
LTDTSKYRQPFPTGTPTSLTVVAWPDRIAEARGHKPGSPYVETTRSKQIFELSECSSPVGGFRG